MDAIPQKAKSALKADDASLLDVEPQPQVAQGPRDVAHERLRFGPALATEDEVVGVANEAVTGLDWGRVMLDMGADIHP